MSTNLKPGHQYHGVVELLTAVCVLLSQQASVEPSVVHCYHDLSKRIAIALKHEEIR